MRISADEKDRGYLHWSITCEAKIFLDGVLMDNDRVLTADEEEGTIVQGRHNEAGEVYVILDPADPLYNTIAYETLRGAVRIEGINRGR